MQQYLFFFFFGILAVYFAFRVITHRNPVYSALYLLATFCSLAGLYVSLGAHFIAFVQVAVYAGAIMVLFLFVIMLLNLKQEEQLPHWLQNQRVVATVVGVFLVVELVLIFSQSNLMTEGTAFEGTVENLGKELFSTFLLPFEIASILLLVAIIGAIYLTKKKLE